MTSKVDVIGQRHSAPTPRTIFLLRFARRVSENDATEQNKNSESSEAFFPSPASDLL